MPNRRPGSTRKRERQVFIFLGGQYENVGDVILRRQLVIALASDVRLHAFVGKAPTDYINGLNLPNDTLIYRSFCRWFLMSFLHACRPRRAAYVLNGGEISCSTHDGLWHTALIPVLAVGRVMGNPGLRVGIGARSRGGVWQWPILVAGRLCRLEVWRDTRSPTMFGTGECGPDWALFEPPSNSRMPRNRVAISFRGDRPMPDPALLRALQREMALRGLQPVCIAQVRRDRHRSQEIADLLGCTHVSPGPDATLQEIEDAARSVYETSAAVVSDRLHALLLGLVCGAVPVCVTPYQDVKIGRTLDAAGLGGLTMTVLGRDAFTEAGQFFGALVDSREEILKRGAAANRRSLAVASRARLVIHGQTS